MTQQLTNIKSRNEIEQEIANESGEKNFMLLLQSEIDVGDIKQAEKLLIDAAKRYLSQFIDK